MDLLKSLRNRFRSDLSDDDIRSTLRSKWQDIVLEKVDDFSLACEKFQRNLDRVYEPTQSAIRAARWVYDLARGIALDRYADFAEYERRCSVDRARRPVNSGIRANALGDDEVPIYAIDGLPGVGKSALFRALERLFPSDEFVDLEGNPPARIRICSAMFIKASRNFSLLSWMTQQLLQFGADPKKLPSRPSIDDVAFELGRLLYRHGVVLLIVDELQWMAGRAGSTAAMNWLLELRKLGIPIVFFANTDLLIKMAEAPAQIAQRIPRDRITLVPCLPEEPAWLTIVQGPASLLPYGHGLDLPKEARTIYDLAAGLPRPYGRLQEISLKKEGATGQPIKLEHLRQAYASETFGAMRKHVEIIRSLALIDVKEWPELSSANSPARELREYRRAVNGKKLADAGRILVRSGMSDAERQAEAAAETEILRNNAANPDDLVAVRPAIASATVNSNRSPDPATSIFAVRIVGRPRANPTDDGENAK